MENIELHEPTLLFMTPPEISIQLRSITIAHSFEPSSVALPAPTPPQPHHVPRLSHPCQAALLNTQDDTSRTGNIDSSAAPALVFYASGALIHRSVQR